MHSLNFEAQNKRLRLEIHPPLKNCSIQTQKSLVHLVGSVASTCGLSAYISDELGFNSFMFESNSAEAS
jgi:hypothetical protein